MLYFNVQQSVEPPSVFWHQIKLRLKHAKTQVTSCIFVNRHSYPIYIEKPVGDLQRTFSIGLQVQALIERRITLTIFAVEILQVGLLG